MTVTQTYNTVANILNWFKKAVPVVAPKNFATQLGVHFEEVAEMIDEITPMDSTAFHLKNVARRAIHELAEHLKWNEDSFIVHENDRKNYLDAICDQLVTGIGCAHMQQLKIVGAAEHVNESNWSKFVNGEAIFDENMKIAKGPDYFKADLSPFV